MVLKLLSFGLGIGAIGLLVAVLAGPGLLSLIYNSTYTTYGTEFVVIMLAGAISYIASFFGYAITAARYFKAQMPLFMAVAAVSLAGAYLMVPEYGLLGASWALVASATTQLIGSAAVACHALHRICRTPDTSTP